MAAVSLTTLRARARERADFTSSAFVSDTATSLDAWINEGAQELHDLLVTHDGDEYAASSTSFSTVVGTSDYSLPTDFLKLLAVDWASNGRQIDLKKFELKERNAYRSQLASALLLPRYRLAGNSIRLYPAPTVVTTVTVWYVPALTVLVNGADTVNFPNGWERYAVLHAAIACLKKEESDARPLEGELATLRGHIIATASNRDAGAPPSAVDGQVSDLEYEDFFL
jgi:hypothetical protein